MEIGLKTCELQKEPIKDSCLIIGLSFPADEQRERPRFSLETCFQFIFTQIQTNDQGSKTRKSRMLPSTQVILNNHCLDGYRNCFASGKKEDT